ncbi:hypothetical protein F8568_016340 [Actinomadura sp. LD22]|uniref:Carbohydrate-binding protein n=1 Tax=Actinomadura physcomitrii TaxID=2650748 RepID=A0A6I4M8B0_9ACTN|nr:hypothetical protein [Actinomadura physcomitrii]MWA01912.1 hypothetical protein [Actinomadura physcomitrii]
MRRAWLVGAVAALVAGLAAPAGAAERPWRTADAPQGLWPESGLNRVAAAGPGDIWAAGFEGYACVDWSWPMMGAGSVCSSNAVVRKWNGSSWENHNPPGAWNLEPVDLDASAPGNVWLSGRNGEAGYLARWDGSRWTQVTPPDACKNSTSLQVEAVADGVWVSNGCLARWQNGTWTTYEPSALGTRAYVSQVYAVSPTDIWASASVLPFRYTVLHWDGTEWTEADVPENYNEVAAAGPAGVWLASPGGSELMRRTSGGWTAMPAAPSAVHGYRIGDDGSLWAAGAPDKPGGAFYRFDGTTWQQDPMPASTGTGSRHRGGFDYTSVPGSGGGMVAVGTAPGGGPTTWTN